MSSNGSRSAGGHPLASTLLDDGGVASEVIHCAKASYRPVLVELAGDEVGRRVTVDRTLVIGRAPNADVVLRDGRVSGLHARLEDRGDGWTLVDLGSRNGTRVNGELVTERELRPGDRLTMGSVVLGFELLDQVAQRYTEFVERLLNLDDLTGLYVRRKFDAELALAIDAARARSAPLGLLVMDLDGVKQINDTHGHLFGAYAIGESGRLIRRVLDHRGFATRFGGDEFIAAVPGFDADAAVIVAEEIRAAVWAHPYEREGIQLRPSISIGVAAFPADADRAEPLFQRADEALYRAKRGGKNRVCR
jgi:diguanylate cyclase (GGDEF)-like protein